MNLSLLWSFIAVIHTFLYYFFQFLLLILNTKRFVKNGRHFHSSRSPSHSHLSLSSCSLPPLSLSSRSLAPLSPFLQICLSVPSLLPCTDGGSPLLSLPGRCSASKGDSSGISSVPRFTFLVSVSGIRTQNLLGWDHNFPLYVPTFGTTTAAVRKILHFTVSLYFRKTRQRGFWTERNDVICGKKRVRKS